jgi:hypothetical protein
MAIIRKQFDRVVFDEFEAPIVSNQIGNQQTGEFVVDMRQFEDGVDNLGSSSAAA